MHEFMHSTPKVLKAYDKAHEERLKRIDTLAWSFCGNYVLSAVSVAVEHCLAGDKAKSKYVNKTILREAEQSKQEKEQIALTEEEIQRQTEQLFLRLQIMGANYNNSHKSDSTS